MQELMGVQKVESKGEEKRGVKLALKREPMGEVMQQKQRARDSERGSLEQPQSLRSKS
jgi:hypothetical protein